MSLKQAIIFGVVFGLTAALVVWYLERFEVNKLHSEIRTYLGNQEGFQDFLRERGDNA